MASQKNMMQTSLSVWIGRGLEAIWLFGVILIPLIFLSKDYVISEAQIAYIEIPKVALLRSLAGLMAILWIAKWVIENPTFLIYPLSNSFVTLTTSLNPSKLVPSLVRWIKAKPARWLFFSATLFFISTILSTIFSGSVTNSIWGEIPGQDGYAAYTIVAYGIIFGAIVNNLRSRAQIARLLGALILMGSLLGLYVCLQHYGHDFFNVLESTGGGTARVTGFQGNAIFVGAVLSMTLPITVVVALLALQIESGVHWNPVSKFALWKRDSIYIFFWAVIVAIQLLGLTFTFSRGPWSGAALALLMFLVLVLVSFGWSLFIRITLVLVLSVLLAVSFLYFQGNGPWIGILLASMGAAAISFTLLMLERFSRTILLMLGSLTAALIVGLAIIVPSAMSVQSDVEQIAAAPVAESTPSQVGERISSIRAETLGGFWSGRASHWRVSWELIKDRPWFEFDDLQFTWLRPLVGYGPDLFRYTYLLRSPPEILSPFPLEPDHAHNFFIHQMVEQGIFGGLASLALFVSVFGITVHSIIRNRNMGSNINRILMIGLAAVIAGRALEMMVGVARISDLTILWVILALFAAMLRFEAVNYEEEIPKTHSEQNRPRVNRRTRRRLANSSIPRSSQANWIAKSAIITVVACVIGVITWQESLGPVRASVAEAKAINYFLEDDLDSSLVQLDKAIRLAPRNPHYHINRAQLFLAYQMRPDLFSESSCAGQSKTPYLTCLGAESLYSNLNGVGQQPFYYRSSIAAGNAAFNLGLYSSAVDSYSEAVQMVPSSWVIKNDLAESQIKIGRYKEALDTLDESIGITGNASLSSKALLLSGNIYETLGNTDISIALLEQSLAMGLSMAESFQVHAHLDRLYSQTGKTRGLLQYDEAARRNPKDVAAVFNQGMAHFKNGNNVDALSKFLRAYTLGLKTGESIAYLAVTYSQKGDLLKSDGYITEALSLEPENALVHKLQGDILMDRASIQSAIESYNSAIALNPFLGLAYFGRGEAYARLGLYEQAIEDFSIAISINPNESESLGARASVYLKSGHSQYALNDYVVAARLDPSNLRWLAQMDKGN